MLGRRGTPQRSCLQQHQKQHITKITRRVRVGLGRVVLSSTPTRSQSERVNGFQHDFSCLVAHGNTSNDHAGEAPIGCPLPEFCPASCWIEQQLGGGKDRVCVLGVSERTRECDTSPTSLSKETGKHRVFRGGTRAFSLATQIVFNFPDRACVWILDSGTRASLQNALD